MSGASKKRLLIGAGAIAVVAAIVVVIVLAGGRNSRGRTDEPTSDQVKLEIRAKPVAMLTMDGRPLGRSPQVVVMKRGTKPLTIEATFQSEKFKLSTRQKISSTLKETRIVVPDASQSVDFNIDDAAPIAPAAGSESDGPAK